MWTRFLTRRRLAREVAPESFRTASMELKELADLAGRLRPSDHEFQVRIRRILGEMEQLDQLIKRHDFILLSLEKRLELKKSLLESRDQLMETVQSAPPPTDRIQ